MSLDDFKKRECIEEKMGDGTLMGEYFINLVYDAIRRFLMN